MVDNKIDISVEDKIRTTRDFYDALVCNDFHLPAFKSPIITVAFLKDVYNGVVYCPKKREIKAHTCVNPPDRKTCEDYLAQGILTAASQERDDEMRKSILVLREYIQKRPADREWLLDTLFLATTGSHAIFKKDYQPPKKQKFV